MQMKETAVTPAMAYKWLEGNTLNRALRQSVVERYARDMKAGKWRLTHEAIAFAPDGTLVDGQHRLWAVIEAGVPIKMMVATDVDADARSVINSGIIRTDVDHLRFGYGIKVTSAEVAIVKRLLRGITKTFAKPTTDEINETLTRHSDAIRFAIDSFPRIVRGITNTPVQTVIARAWYHADRDKLRHFVEQLVDGRFSSPDEETILMLRNYLLERAPRTMTRAADVVYAKTERALWAYLHGERIAMLYPASNEMFPLPDEPTISTRLSMKAGEKQKQVAVTIAARPTTTVRARGTAKRRTPTRARGAA